LVARAGFTGDVAAMFRARLAERLPSCRVPYRIVVLAALP
jgi:hypothetical protein